jgi:hypothetical protein
MTRPAQAHHTEVRPVTTRLRSLLLTEDRFPVGGAGWAQR